MLQAYIIDLLFGGCAVVQEDLKKSDFLSLIQQGKFSQATNVLNKFSSPNDRMEFLGLLYSQSKSFTQINNETTSFLITTNIALRNLTVISSLKSPEVQGININNPFLHLLISARLPIPFSGKAKLLLALDNLIIDLLQGKVGNFSLDFACNEYDQKDFSIIKDVTEKILRNENNSFWLLFNTLGISKRNEEFISLTQADKIASLKPLSPTKIGSWVGIIDSRLILTITDTLTQKKFLEYTA